MAKKQIVQKTQKAKSTTTTTITKSKKDATPPKKTLKQLAAQKEAGFSEGSFGSADELALENLSTIVMKKARTFKEPSVETSELVQSKSPLIHSCHDNHQLHGEINLAFVETHTRVERPKA